MDACKNQCISFAFSLDMQQIRTVKSASEWVCKVVQQHTSGAVESITQVCGKFHAVSSSERTFEIG